MAINFPNSPAVNDTFTVSGTTFTFTGVKWETSAVVELSSDTTPTLGGTLDAGTNNINNVGVITATTFSGNLTGNAQGLTGDPSIQVTNATVLGNLDVQGTTTTIDTAVTEVDSLQVDGNVGIGTTNATEILHVQTGPIDEVTTFKVKTAGRVELLRNHAGAPYIKTLMTNGDPNIILGDSGGDKVLINGDGNSYFNGGNVGIGTENPLNGLDIVSSTGRTRVTEYGHIITRNHNHSVTNYWSFAPRNGGELDIGYGAADGQGTVAADKVTITTAGNVTATGTISDSKGGLRDIPLNDESTNASYTLVASDAGKVVHAHSTTTTVVVPNSVFSVGNVVTILNGGTGNIAVNQGSGFALRNTADGSSGNRTLAQFGMATIYFTSASIGYISGSNMT